MMTAQGRDSRRAKAYQREAVRVLERDIERTCTEFLELDGWRALKTDPVRNREWGKGFGELGMADCLYIRYVFSTQGNAAVGQFYAQADAKHMWIEWKRIHRARATGAKQHQKDWHAAERARGALTLIAGEDFPATIEGFQKWYFGSGLARKVRPA